jgi:hypothetical protein
MEDTLILNRYRLLETKAHGGFSTVQIAWDTRVQRRVAIKSIPLEQDGPSLLTPGLEEARTAALLSNPSIVGVLDFEHDDDNAYIIMKYVDGPTLGELLDHGDRVLDLDIVAAVVASVSEALEYAHENQVLHLDIKPDNILIDRSGQIMVSDFGVAQIASPSGYGTAYGGTIGYMPPEQMSGGRLDERTDEWAFASVVYEMLCGRNPFASKTIEGSLDAIMNGEFYEPSALRPDLDPAVDDALFIALSPRMEERFPSVAEFTDDLLVHLGNPAAGRKKLRRDLATEEQAEIAVTREPGRIRRAISSIERTLVGRLIACASGAWLTWQATLSAGLSTPMIAAFTICVALGCFATPQFGSIIAIICLDATLCLRGEYILAGVLGFLAFVWWLPFGRKGVAESTLPLAAPLLALCWIPNAFPLLCGFHLPWRRSIPALLFGSAFLLFVTACTGGTLGSCKLFFIDSSPRSPLFALLINPEAWLMLVGWLFADILMALLCARGSRVLSIVGSALGCILVLGCQALVLRFDIGSWVLPAMRQIALIVVTFVFMCIISALGAPQHPEQEVEGV